MVGLAKQSRRGMATMEAIFALGILLPIAAIFYMLAQRTLGNLYHVIASLIAHPFI